jgi:hypothetical protein
MHSSLWRSRHWLVRLIYSNISHTACFLICLHSVPVTLGTYYDDLPTREFIVEDVRVNFKYRFPHDLTNRPFWSFSY